MKTRPQFHPLSAAVGGTASELGGGKFANGAVTAAFLRLYNEELDAIHKQNAAARQRIVDSAQRITDMNYNDPYGRWPANTNKCNCLVYYALSGADVRPEIYDRSEGVWREPTADDWATPGNIRAVASNGRVIGSFVFTAHPQAGDVAAISYGGAAGASGHTVIYMYPGTAAPVYAAHSNGVYASTYDRLAGAGTTYRTFQPR